MGDGHETPGKNGMEHPCKPELRVLCHEVMQQCGAAAPVADDEHRIVCQWSLLLVVVIEECIFQDMCRCFEQAVDNHLRQPRQIAELGFVLPL